MISIRDNGFGKRTIFDPSPFGPLILEDAGTVSHVLFNGTALVDTKGNSWTQNGTVPQIGRSGKTPAGAGAFSDANYYSLGTGNDILDFAGDFSAAFVCSPPTVGRVLFYNGLDSTDGWGVQTGAANVFQHWESWAATHIAASTANSMVSGPNVCCAGRSGTTTYAKLNLGAIASAIASITAGTARVAKLGRYESAGFPWDGSIYEVWFSTTTPSDALFTAIANRVKSRAGITAW